MVSLNQILIDNIPGGGKMVGWAGQVGVVAGGDAAGGGAAGSTVVRLVHYANTAHHAHAH